MKQLHLAHGFHLPLDAVTQSIGILAKRRAGKSYTARRITEQLMAAKLQVVIVDPKGDWWGIRSAADGKSPGLPITILGGQHGDLPLEVNSGEVVAKLVVYECVSVLLDLSHFRKNEVATFMTGFMEAFYRLKANEQYRSPVMLVVDEADAIAPQKPYKGEERMLGAIEDIVRRGGQRGIGCLLITQRSAVLNKNVLTQVQVLVAMRTIAPQDLAAMDAWVDVHGTTEQRKVLMESLPSLPTGDAWFWSPGWPTEDGIFKRVHVLAIQTFDSGATPKPGEKRIAPKNLADVDLDALRRQMAETIERAKAEDPRELRKQIAELKKQVAAKAPAPAAAGGKIDRGALQAEFERGAAAERSRLIKIFERLFSQARGKWNRIAQAVGDEPWGAFTEFLKSTEHARPAAAPIQMPAPRSSPAPPRPAPAAHRPVDPDGRATAPQQRILDSLAWLETIRLPHGKRQIVGFLADASPSSSAFANNLGALRSAGLIDYPGGNLVALTAAGRAAAAQPATPLSPEELHRMLYTKLPGPQSRIVQSLVKHYPDSIDKERLAAEVEASATSSAFANNLGALRSLGIIGYPSSGQVVALPILFLE
jgi:uncharacterized protein DUF87